MPTLPAHLRAHGYGTVTCGKVFHSARHHDDASWSRVIPEGEGLAEPGPLPEGWDRRSSGPTGRPDDQEPDGMIAQQGAVEAELKALLHAGWRAALPEGLRPTE